MSASSQQKYQDYRSIRGIDHIGLTVPDIEEATQFFKQAFGARICYDTLTPQQPAQEGAESEQKLGLREGAKVRHIRLIQIGQGASIEMFQFENTQQRSPALAVDYGIQHMALYVEDMSEAIRHFESAGGILLSSPNPLPNVEKGEEHLFVYGRAPWGTLIELLSYPHGIDYPQTSESHRWTPPAVK